MLSAYRDRVRDLIQWNPGADGVWRPHNVGDALLSGWELEGSLALSGPPLRVDGSWTRLHAVDAGVDRVTGGKTLVGRARDAGFVELGWEPGSWAAAVGVRGVGRVPLTPSGTKWQAGYAVWEARLRRRITPELRADLEARNLFDARYQDLRGYAAPGREVLFGLRYAPGGLAP